ncbi:MAG TPA: helix-turn-helix domain-containing protein [Vicinamibacterales bacterium]
MYEIFADLLYPCMFELSRACQLAIGDLYAGTLTLHTLPARFSSVPRPVSLPGAMIARSALLTFTDHFGREHHRAFHSTLNARPCGFDPCVVGVDVHIDATNWDAFDPRAIVTRWARDLQKLFAAAHGPDFVTLARERLRPTPIGPRNAGDVLRREQTISQMACEIGCSPPTLRRHFAIATGGHLVAYRTTERVVAAIELLRTTDWKIEVIARAVGWKSKKNLYAAFAVLVEATPGTVRRMSEAEAAGLIARLRGSSSLSFGHCRPAIPRTRQG